MKTNPYSLHNYLQLSTTYRNKDDTSSYSTRGRTRMDPPKRNGKENPYQKANWLSRLTWSWTVPLLRLGYKRRLEHKDIYKIPLCYETTGVTDQLKVEWEKQVEKQKYGRNASFRWAIARAFGLQYMASAGLILIEDTSRIVQPILLQYLIQYFTTDTHISTSSAYWLATGIALCTVFEMFSGPQIVFALIRCGVTWQSASVGLVYRKVLKLSNKSRSTATSGHITDLISTDCEKLDWLVWVLFSVWQAPLHSVIILTLLYYQLGPSIFAGLGIICVMLPAQALIAKVVAHYKKYNLTEMDERVGVMSEIVSAMKVIKMYCWERPFGEVVQNIRRKELRFLWKGRVWFSLLIELYTFNQRFIMAVIVLVYVATQGDLTPAKIFPAFALFNLLTESLLNQVPMAIKLWLDVGVSAKRIEEFLLLEEKDQSDDMIHSNAEVGNIKLSDVSASWTLDAPRNTLENINLQCTEKNKLLMVIGDVGSGKSSLLMSIMGELPISEGIISCGGRIAYSPQQPWVFTSTLKQNILFGEEFDSEKYYKVIKAAVLDKDISDLPYGDNSLVGEKGVTLSGGQKARLSLARALYREADIYLLDDPLSAVDSTVGNDIMNKCIKGMLKDKTVILVTHQLQYLPEASQIIIMKEGKIDKCATYSELIESGFDFGKVYHDLDHTGQTGINRQLSAELPDNTFKTQVSHKDQPDEEAEEEHRQQGQIDWTVYKSYFRAGASWPVIIMFASLCVTTQAAYNIGDWWLAVWTVAGEDNVINTTSYYTSATQLNTSMVYSSTTNNQQLNNYGYASIYMVFITSMISLGLARTWLFYKITVQSSQTLHDKVYKAVIRSPIRFFDTTPKGRILNRFSGDMSKTDNTVPDKMLEFLQVFLMVCGSVLVMMIINPFVIIPTIPVIIALVIVRTVYQKSKRHLSRLMSTAKSPLLGHLSNTLEGVEVIRAFKAEGCCTRDFDTHNDFFTGMWLTDIGIFGWFQFWNDALAGIFNIMVTYACVMGASYLGPGEAGLILSYVVPFMWQIETCLRTSSDTEAEMVGVERIMEYTKLPSERPLESSPQDKPSDTWPAKGKVVFDHLSFAYSLDSPLILHDIQCRVEAGQKVGIVGRTGAGKSSLIQALFRMAEPSGQVWIDDVITSELGLHDVRGSMCIIPQDPVLFSGTVRSNLDPFSEIDDKDIWKALDQVQLKESVSELVGALDSKVTESGHNFSVGQRQLFCLARALLRRNNILVMDEATANVDKKTDDLIQQTIRQEFRDCTVLTVAHRLNTVMDSDKIMVLDKGHLVEYDAPYNLIQHRGLFYKMVEQTGRYEAQRLTDIARTSLVNKTVHR